HRFYFSFTDGIFSSPTGNGNIDTFDDPINYSDMDENGDTVGVKLLVDSGASHALSIYDITNKKIKVPSNTLHSFLGAGLSGDIFGEIGRVQKFNIGGFSFNEVVTSFPDEEGIQRALDYSDRNGSLGAEVLKRFRVIYNYPEEHIQLKPNSNYKKEFQYNMSGLEITTPMPGMPIYEISKVRNNSPAMAAGLAKGDQIIMINGVNATKYSLNDIVRLLHSREGRKIKLFVQRYNQYYKAEFILDDSISFANNDTAN
nr:PDZ domain-containing protein [Flammeovirgaceae bacterium]